jgi:thiamine biosynthesis lipoprotein
MGTEIRVSILTEDETAAHAAADRAVDEFRRLEELMSHWKPESDVSRINRNAGVAPVTVSDETLEVLELSRKASDLSSGAFDITFYAMHGLWKFDHDLEAKVPDPQEIARRKKLIDYRQVIIDRAKKTAFLAKKGMALNLGGIAKGYAVDRAVEILRNAGFRNAIVQAGGDLMCAGSKDGRPWTSGIRDPRGERNDVFATLQLQDHAFSTAGDYERFFIIDGKRYHHIIDPHTGYPAMRSRSVTIYAKNAFWADALDDAVFILGWKKGIEMIEKLDDVGAVVVDENGEVHTSERVREHLQIIHPPHKE